MSEARYRIGTLARLTGVSTHALRVWERRYRAFSPSRTAGGARLYTHADVERLQLVKRLLERGYTISSLAHLGAGELGQLLPKGERPPLAANAPRDNARAWPLVEELLAAVAALDMQAAELALSRANNAFAPHDLLTLVLAPALEEVGRRWASGDICTASEHAASALLRTELGRLLAAQPVTGKAPVVCTTLAGEQHELGALLAAVVVAMHGRRAVYLGANLPAEQIAHAVRLSRAGAIALSVVGLGASDALPELRELMRLLPRHVEVLLGGRRVGEFAALPERVQGLTSLADLESWLARTTR